ncbi:MAG TPA: hypothetical protein VGO62_07040, partial [Myxococcota bacterium]
LKADALKPDKPEEKVEAESKPHSSSSSHKEKSEPKKSSSEALHAAKTALLQGDAQTAVDALTPFDKTDIADVHRLLGVGYAKLHKTNKAAAHYKRYLELKPDAVDAAQVRAILEGKSATP